MSFVQTEVDHLQLIVRNYPTKYLYNYIQLHGGEWGWE